MFTRCAVFLLAVGGAAAAEPGVTTPLAALETGGPAAAVTALAFSPDGATLYSAGHDKVVRAWRRDPAGGAFALDPAATLRVPIGPGRDGVLNVLAVSPDGAWVAAAGLSVFTKASGFGTDGWMNPPAELQPDMKRERYAVWLFNPAARTAVPLRAHVEDVLALAFVPGAGKPRLVSVGRRDGRAGRDIDRPGVRLGRRPARSAAAHVDASTAGGGCRRAAAGAGRRAAAQRRRADRPGVGRRRVAGARGRARWRGRPR
jgi:hypothetical protein